MHNYYQRYETKWKFNCGQKQMFCYSDNQIISTSEKEQNEFEISKQLLRSGTSICANVKEGLRAQSSNDFRSKMNIALKEASETE